MPRARKDLISLEATPFYHCIARCVRRAYLCGEDRYTGQNYDHRKQWIVVRLQQLASVFTIDVCAYSVMSTHYHTVLHVNQSKANALSEREVAERWTSLFNGHPAIQSWLSDEHLNENEQQIVDNLLKKWRGRLSDISWFMRCMNETVARKANKEDDCTGRFWEGRFTSQPLLDDVALLACMTYVDLNPIRANICNTPEASDYTSVQKRLYEHLRTMEAPEKQNQNQLKTIEERINTQEAPLTKEVLDPLPQADLPRAPLMPFDGCSNTPINIAITFSLVDYFELVDMTGRILREDKKGFIPSETPSLIDRLYIKPDKWIHSIKRYGSMFTVAASSSDKIRKHAEGVKSAHWFKGVRQENLVKKPACG